MILYVPVIKCKACSFFHGSKLAAKNIRILNASSLIVVLYLKCLLMNSIVKVSIKALYISVVSYYH